MTPFFQSEPHTIIIVGGESDIIIAKFTVTYYHLSQYTNAKFSGGAIVQSTAMTGYVSFYPINNLILSGAERKPIF